MLVQMNRAGPSPNQPKITLRYPLSSSGLNNLQDLQPLKKTIGRPATWIPKGPEFCCEKMAPNPEKECPLLHFLCLFQCWIYKSESTSMNLYSFRMSC